MFKKSPISILVISFLGTNANAALPIYPAEIIARDLNIAGASWAGHVGITTAPNLTQDAYQVIEVLKDADPIIQTNLILTFKTQTPYWGSRYGIADRGNNALRILREANFQKVRILTKVNGDSTDRERYKNHDYAGSIFYS